jgi:hypothetical protein
MKVKIDSTPLPSPEQAEIFATGVERLQRAVEEEDWVESSIDNATKIYDMPEYDALLELAYTTGVVHGELSPDGFQFDLIDARPQEQLGALSKAEIRRYLHALYRCERHNWGWGSLVLSSVQSGALGIAARRLTACS